MKITEVRRRTLVSESVIVLLFACYIEKRNGKQNSYRGFDDDDDDEL